VPDDIAQRALAEGLDAVDCLEKGDLLLARPVAATKVGSA
jgi:hypothetical protein